jgi:hypothetical protein
MAAANTLPATNDRTTTPPAFVFDIPHHPLDASRFGLHRGWTKNSVDAVPLLPTTGTVGSTGRTLKIDTSLNAPLPLHISQQKLLENRGNMKNPSQRLFHAGKSGALGKARAF